MMENEEALQEQMSDIEWEERRAPQDARIIREFINDTRIPQDILLKLWSLWSKDGILANLDKTTSNILRRRMQIMLERITQYNSYYNLDPNFLLKLKQIEQTYQARNTRAEGANRERILLGKGVEEKRIVTETNKEESTGMFNRAKSFFGFGGF